MKSKPPIILAMTGASGVCYGLRLLEFLLQADYPVYLLISKAAQAVLAMETDLDVPARPQEAQSFFVEHFRVKAELLTVLGREQWRAPIASGSHRAQHMVICPCTTGTLSAIANGASDNLLERAADVMIKEQRKLLLVVRETPLSAIHLENMHKLAILGVTIMPANPGFYHKPETLRDIEDFMLARILDHLGIEHQLLSRWGDEQQGNS